MLQIRSGTKKLVYISFSTHFSFIILSSNVIMVCCVCYTTGMIELKSLNAKVDVGFSSLSQQLQQVELTVFGFLF